MYSHRTFRISSLGDPICQPTPALGLVPVGMFCFRSIQARRWCLSSGSVLGKVGLPQGEHHRCLHRSMLALEASSARFP